MTPPRLTTPARQMLKRLKRWDVERFGMPVLAAENVAAAVELQRKGLIELRNGEGTIEVVVR